MADRRNLGAQVWFQNRRAKWKKRKKTTNVFRTPGALLPSHGLSPFGTMNDSLCSFQGADTRWTGMTQMGQMASGNPLSLPPSLPRQGIAQSLPPVSIPGLGGGSSIGLANMANGVNGMNCVTGSTSPMYSSTYGVSTSCDSPLTNGNSPPSMTSQMTQMSQMACGMQGMDDSWRGSSIASLRRKALEHTVSMTGVGVAGFR